MKTKNYITKVRSQFKSSYYYLFWGAATIAVVAGQIYVGSGYRVLGDEVEELIEKCNQIQDPVLLRGVTNER